MPRFEVGKVYNLGGNKPAESEEIKPSRPIGFNPSDIKIEKPRKMDKIGFAPSSKEEESAEELKEK